VSAVVGQGTDKLWLRSSLYTRSIWFCISGERAGHEGEAQRGRIAELGTEWKQSKGSAPSLLAQKNVCMSRAPYWTHAPCNPLRDGHESQVTCTFEVHQGGRLAKLGHDWKHGKGM
jgi:hypothetical protein